MATFYFTIRQIAKEITDAINSHTHTFEGFTGSVNQNSKWFFSDSLKIHCEYHPRTNEISIDICEEGEINNSIVSIIYVGLPVEQIDSKKYVIDAVREELELLVAHYVKMLDEFNG